MDDVIIDEVKIIDINRTVWKAWKRIEKSSAWPNGYDYSTITHFAGETYGRMGTEVFICPPMPDDERERAWRAGRLDSICAEDGTSVSREWRFKKAVEHSVACARAAHLAILKRMPTRVEGKVILDDDGTIVVEK